MGTLVAIFIICLSFVVVGSILGMTSASAVNRLQRQNKNLNSRLEKLESSLKEGRFGSITPLAPAAVKEAEISLSPEPVKEAAPALSPAPVREPTPEPIVDPIPDSIFTPQPAPIPPQTPLQPAPASAAQPATTWELPQRGPKKPMRDLEEMIGGQWSVWVGGLALLVGAVLLIRFSIEAGIFGPGARIIMALGLGAALLLAGEWLKRSDDKVLTGKLGDAAKALQENASVPGLLSAVGIFTLLGASYAAHALYGLIPAFAAFVALAMISLGAMALSLRQGPLLAGIGLLASLTTPLLIQTNTPSLLMLIVYLVLIGGAALILARRTGWGWLATGTVFGWLFWSFMSLEAARGGQLALWSAFLALGFVVTVWFADRYKTRNELHADITPLHLSSVWAIFWAILAAVLVATLVAINGFSQSGITLPYFILAITSVGALIGASVLFRKQSAHLVIAGLLGLGFLSLSEGSTQTIIFMISLVGIVVLSLYQTERKDAEGQKNVRADWTGFAVALGLASVAVLDITNRAAHLDFVHAAIALGFTALFAATSLWFKRRGADRKIISIPVIGAGLGWTLAGLLAFDGLPFSVFISLGAALAAVTLWRVRMPGTRLVLLGLAGLVFAHALFVQFPESAAISSFPIFNELWIYLTLPAAILAAAAYVLHLRETEDKRTKLLDGAIEAAALAGFALFAVFQIRHLSNGGDVYADSLGHAELGLQTSIGLCFTLAGLSKRFSGNLVLSKAAEIISYVTLGIFALLALVVFSPFFRTGELINGNLFFNSLTTGLLVPTILLGACAVMARGKRPEAYINMLGGLALAGALSWVTAMIRFIFNGAKINVWSVNFGALELWTISAIWLAFGIALLALGVWRRKQALRIASGVVIILTVLKAFIIDMAGLEGVLRALSFVALGLILIVIGRAYQRYWLSDEMKEEVV